MVMHAMFNAWGGEVFIPKIPSYRIIDVAKAIGPECDHKIVGIRPGEKIHEEMITASDSFNTFSLGKYYTILPSKPVWDLSKFIETFDAKPVDQGFNYNSGTNENFLTIEELRSLIKENVSPGFEL